MSRRIVMGCASRRARAVAPLVVAAGVLVWPGTAAAHSGSPTVALDVVLRLGAPPEGVHPSVIDGDRKLRLRVDPNVTLLVRGLLREPFLRFSRTGVWVDTRSPTAAAAKLVGGAGRSGADGRWIRLTRDHDLAWHDHRLAPPPALRSGASAAWSLPVVLDGRPTTLTGRFTRVARPPVWPWLVGAVAVLVGLTALLRTGLHGRDRVAALLAVLAAAAALAGSAAFAIEDAISGAGEWIEVGSAALLALVAAGALLIRDRAARIWVVGAVGAIAAALGLGSLSVFWHGIVISALPPTLARLTTAIAVVAGGAAALVATVAGDEKPPRARIEPPRRPARPRAARR